MKKPLAEYGIVRMLNYAADMVILSLMWCVCSLPIVTVGVASAALYHTVVKVLIEEKGYVFSSFIQSIRDSWKQALPIGAVLALVCSAIFFLAYRILLVGNVGALRLLFAACAIVLLHLLLVQIHLYPLIGHFNLGGKALISLVVKMTSSFFFRNAALLAIFLAAAFAMPWDPPLFAAILPAGYAWVAAKLQAPMFARYIRIPPEPGEGEGARDEAGEIQGQEQ